MGMHCRNPPHKPRENPPGEEKAVPKSGSKKPAHMEKFKEAVMKRLITAPNAPLSETHKALLGERVSHVVSLLHTPDHPPYAWMIERALRELNETWGSSEDSISQFIRKEYDDLPCSHFTMLKYHLDRLCQSGELALTRFQRYLLTAETSERKTKRKCRRKSVKRKKGWDRKIMQSKRRSKVNREKNSLHRDDEVGSLFSQQTDHVTSTVIHDEEECSIGENKQQTQEDDDELHCIQRNDQLISKEVHEQQVFGVEGNKHEMLNSDEVELFSSQEKCFGVSKDVNEERDCIMQGNKQQKSKAKGKTGPVKFDVAENIIANGNSDVPFNKPSSLVIIDGETNLPMFRMQQRTVEPIGGRIDRVCPDALLGLGFDSVAFEQSSQFQPLSAVSSELPVHPEQLSQNYAPGYSDAQEKCSEPEVFSDEELLPTGSTQRYMRRKKRQSRDKTSLPSAEKQDGYPPKPGFCDEDRVQNEGQTSVEHQREKKVARGNRTSSVLRSQHERQKPEYPIHRRMHPKVKPVTEILNELTRTIHQTKEDQVFQGPKSEPSKGAIGDKLLKHDIKQRQLGRGRGRGRGRPPNSNRPAKAIADGLLVGDIPPSNDQDHQHPDYSLLPHEKLDITVTENSLLKPADNQQLEQHLRTARLGRPPKPKGDANTVVKSSLKHLRKPRLGRPPKPKGDTHTVVKSSLKHQTRYRGRGRPPFTDIRD